MGFIESECAAEELIKEVVGHDELIVVSSDMSLKKELYIDELFSKKWILREKGSGTRDIFFDAIEKLSKELNILMEYRDFAEVKELLLKNTDAITCISKIAVQKELKSNELQAIKLKNIKVKRNFYCIYHKNKYKSKLLESLMEFVRNSSVWH